MQDKECATLHDTKSMQNLYIIGFIDSTKMTFFKKLCTTFVGHFHVFSLVVVTITIFVVIPLLSDIFTSFCLLLFVLLRLLQYHFCRTFPYFFYFLCFKTETLLFQNCTNLVNLCSFEY